MIVTKAKRSPNGGLVITRKEGESITLYDRRDGSELNIVLTQARIDGNKSKIHINAPEWVGIVRTEIAHVRDEQ